MNFHPTALREAIFYAASFASFASLAANTAQQVVAPASNTAGLVVHSAHQISFNGTTGLFVACSLLAKAGAAPASPADGDLLGGGFAMSNATNASAAGWKMGQPVFIAAGKGLWFITNRLETDGLRGCLYTLLA